MNNLLLFIIGLFIFVSMDFIWIGLINNTFYKKSFKDFGRIKKNKWNLMIFPAILSWAFIIFGIIFFVLNLSRTSLQAAFLGAVFGFVIYGVYDMTNLSTIKNWSIKFSLVDVLWGTFVCGIISFVLFIVH